MGTRDFLDDYIDGRIRGTELCVAVVLTGITAKLIDVAGLSDQVTSAVDWMVAVIAFCAMMYFTAAGIHDWFDARRDRKYHTVYAKKHQEDVA